MPNIYTGNGLAEELAQLWACDKVVNLLAQEKKNFGKDGLCYSHGIITCALRKLAYRQSSDPCTVRYSYGMEKEPRKLCVPHLGPETSSRAGQQRTHQFYVGLLAGRHTAMEPGIDFHLLLNHEVNPNVNVRTNEYDAETVARERATDMFNELPCNSTVRLVQTGWVPVVMGFYRAFFAFVSSPTGRRDVTVVPVITRPEPKAYVGRGLWNQAECLKNWAPGLFELSNSELTLLREGGLSTGELCKLKSKYPALTSRFDIIQQWAIGEAPAF